MANGGQVLAIPTVTVPDTSHAATHFSPSSWKGERKRIQLPPRASENDTPNNANIEDSDALCFMPNDPANPYNWPQTWKVFIVFTGVLAVLNSTLGSSLPSGNIEPLASHFKIKQKEQLVLPNSIYLVGYMLGPLLFAPLSERYGRQIIMLSTFAGFTVFSLAICLSPNWPAFIIFRLIKGTCASTPISVIGGLYADLYESAETRGRALAIFMTANLFGPVAGPIASGYFASYGWRWPFWFGLIFASVTWIPLAFLPETFGPVILQRRATKLARLRSGGTGYAASNSESSSGFWIEMSTTLSRPWQMLFTEAIVVLVCLYLALVFAILYIFFDAYPLIFASIYGFNAGETGLAFLPIAIGGLFAFGIYLLWEKYLLGFRRLCSPPSWSCQEEYRRLPLACLGGPLFTIGCLWLGWATRHNVHWIVPILAGLPWGCGYLLLFMSLMNYLVDAYGIYSASALAASTCTRSLLGALMPFATASMYRTLGPAWACSLLGFVSAGLIFVPFGLIKFGDKIISRSKFCQELKTRSSATTRE